MRVDCREQRDEELHDLNSSPNTIRTMKLRRIKLAGHLVHIRVCVCVCGWGEGGGMSSKWPLSSQLYDQNKMCIFPSQAYNIPGFTHPLTTPSLPLATNTCYTSKYSNYIVIHVSSDTSSLLGANIISAFCSQAHIVYALPLTSENWMGK
jgi:hypothetical protein